MDNKELKFNNSTNIKENVKSMFEKVVYELNNNDKESIIKSIIDSILKTGDEYLNMEISTVIKEILMEILKNGNIIITGSCLLPYLTKDKSIVPNDIDVACNEKNEKGYNEIIRKTIDILLKKHKKFSVDSYLIYDSYDRNESNKNIKKITTIKIEFNDSDSNPKTVKFDFIYVKSIQEYIKSFDLNFIKNYTNGKKLFIEHLFDLVNRESKIYKPYSEKSESRIKKYRDRGFKIIEVDKSIKSRKRKREVLDDESDKLPDLISIETNENELSEKIETCKKNENTDKELSETYDKELSEKIGNEDNIVIDEKCLKYKKK